jgi:hypothetical protein
MKRTVLALVLATTCGALLRAQDNHHGPVVYPGNMSPDSAAYTNTPPSSGPFLASNGAPAPAMPPDNTLAAPTPGTSAPAQANPAMSPLQGVGNAAGPAAANGKPDDIYDIRPPFFYLKPLTWLWVSLGALAAIALIIALWIWLKPLRAFRSKSPYELALEKLEKARAMLNEENPEPYAVFVSETIRSYLGARFKILSTRRTTEEFLRQMSADPNTPLAAHRDQLRSFLEACDLVKFAHYQPARDELEQVQERAVSFVTATRPMEGAPA